MSYLSYTQPVKGDHPRLLVSDTNGPTVATIKARTTSGYYSSYWSSFTSWCNTNVGAANSVFNNYGIKAMAIPFYYLMTGSSTFGSKAASIATYLIGLGGQGEETDRETIIALACIYDWAYDYLTTSQRSSIRSHIANLCSNYYTPKVNERVYGHSELNCFVTMLGHMAIMSDSDDSGNNTTYRTRFETSLDGWEDGTNDSFSAVHSYVGDDEGGTFKGSGPWCYWHTAAAWRPLWKASMKSALNVNVYAQNPWYANVMEWIAWHLGRKDTLGHRDGEQRNSSNFYTWSAIYFLHIAQQETGWKGTFAQWLAREQDRVNYNTPWGPYQFLRLIFYEPTRGSTLPTLQAVNSGNQCKCFPKMMTTCFRTGFDWNTDTSFVIRATPFWGGHSQRGPGHWSLESRGDAIFVRHGHYDGHQTTTYWDQTVANSTNTGHRYCYYNQQISATCLRIYDSNEPSENRLDSFQHHMSASTYFGIKKTTGEWISNQGGCLWPKTSTTYPYTLTQFLAEPDWNWNSIAYGPVENSKYAYVVYDLKNWYYSGKITRYKLHALWIKPKALDTNWNDPIILLWYDCTSHIDSNSTKGGRKTQTLHLQTQAQMTGSADLLQITRANSKCWVKTYTPAVNAELVSGFKDLDGNTYVPTSTPARDDSLYPSGSSPWRAEIYPTVASTNPSFFLALAPAALSASVSNVPFGTLVDNETYRGIQFGNYIIKMAKGDTHSAVYEDVSEPLPEPTPPTPPYGLTAQAYDSNVNLTWYQTEATMDHWNIYRRTRLTAMFGGDALYSPWAKIDEHTLKTYNDGTVVNDTTYQYTVTAVDDEGEESSYSTFSDEVTPQALVPVPDPPPPIVLPPAQNNIRRAAGMSFSMTVLPCPDGTIGKLDRPHASWLYPGIDIIPLPIDYSVGSEIESPTAVDGAELSCSATAVDGEELSCTATAEEGEEI